MNTSGAIGMIGSAALLMLTACTRGTEREGTRGMMGRGGMPMMRPDGMMAASADTAAAPRPTARVATALGCPSVSQGLVDAGRKVFTGTGNCYACHGSDAHGTAVAPNLTDATWLDIDGSYAGIASLVQSGVPQPKQFPTPMPPRGGAQLDQSRICALAAYVYSLPR
jgi:mono/diheme cytochrome c family protein